jgi:hypothetical protein
MLLAFPQQNGLVSSGGKGRDFLCFNLCGLRSENKNKMINKSVAPSMPTPYYVLVARIEFLS